MNPLLNAIVGLHIRLFRWTNGRVGSAMSGQPMVLLTTTGNKSGKARTVPVMCLEDGGERYVIASFGGSPKHPAWFVNLKAKPEVTVEVRGRRFDARAEIVEGPERARLWSVLVAKMPQFAKYQTKTTREIPVVRLKETA
jgi:F420H(2)-dependent quinone reductase